MKRDELGTVFRQIADEVCKATDPRRCWTQVLNLSGQSSNQRLSDVDVNADIYALQMQLVEIFKITQLPPNLAFFYFGLFDQASGIGYYVSGYDAQDASGTLSSGKEPSFFPANRFLSSCLLKAIDAETERMPPEREALTYTVTFGAGATLSRFATMALKLREAVYVGFDSGDFARVK